MTENNINIGENLLETKIIINKNNVPVDTKVIKKLIDYVDDESRCLLLKGAWYFFNDDYINYLQDSISEIPIIFDSQYDFSSQLLADYQEKKFNLEKILPEYIGLETSQIKKKINDKYYAERVFNLVMKELYGFTNYDRIESRLGNEKIELMDLYQNVLCLL